MAKIYYMKDYNWKHPSKTAPFNSKMTPKYKEWKINYWNIAEDKHYTAIIVNNQKGLTAFEAWEQTHFPGNPPFHECTYEGIGPYVNGEKEKIAAGGTKRSKRPRDISAKKRNGIGSNQHIIR